ncbi:MAG: DUF5667 domain-containing protein [Patescibacteria group bacterium]
MFNQEEKRIIDQLKNLNQIQPDFDYLESFGRVLKTKVNLEKSFAPQPKFVWFKFIKTGLAAVFSFIFIFGLSWGMVLAIQQVSPGTIFYPVKLAGEKLQLEISKNDPKSRAELRIKFANNRLTEIKILEENNALDEEKLKQALEGYNSEINAIQQELLQIVDYENGETLDYLLALESKLEEINSSLQGLASEVKQYQSFIQANDLSKFIQEVASLKILDYEIQNQVFGQDEKKLQRLVEFLSRLKNKQEALALQFSQNLSLELETQSVEISDSGELNVSPAPGQEQEFYQQLLEIKAGLDKISSQFSSVDSDENLLKLLQALNNYEVQLAKIEQLLLR